MERDVGVDKRDDFACCHVGSPIPGVGRTARNIARSHDAVGCFLGNGGRRVGAAIVDDNELPLVARQIAQPQRIDAEGKVAIRVTRRNDDRETHAAIHRPAPIPARTMTDRNILSRPESRANGAEPRPSCRFRHAGLRAARTKK